MSVSEWLSKVGLQDLIATFESQKLNSFRRVQWMSDDMIKELIPEIGLRVEFMDALATLKSEIREGSDIDTTKSQIQQPSAALDKQPVDKAVPATRLPELMWESVDVDVLQDDLDCSGGTSEVEVQGLIDLPSTSTSPPESHTAFTPSIKEGKKRKRSNGIGPSRVLTSWKALEQLKALDLKEILKKDLCTEAIVRKYNQNGTLTEADRAAVILVLVREMLTVNANPSHAEYQLMSEKIVEVFPYESAQVYYCAPDECHRNCTGKLPNKVKNFKYSLAKKEAGPLPKPPDQNLEGNVPSTSFSKPAVLSGLTDKNDIVLKEAISALKHQSTDSLPDILRNWSVTHAFRLQSLQETRPQNKTKKQNTSDQSIEDGEELLLVNEYFDEWNVLLAATGYLLINQDFSELYPGKENALLSRWDSSKYLIVELARKEVSKGDTVTLKFLEDIDTAPKGKEDILTFLLLPSLCCKGGRGKKGTSRSLSTVEARRSLILHVKIPGDLKREVRNYHSSIRSQGLRVQPFIVIVGPDLMAISACYVQIDNVRYKLRTFLAAVDTCFKAFFALDAAYPEESYEVWLLIQRYFYELFLREDKNTARVTTVMSSLRAMASKVQ